jgi:peptidoglycan/LPS O-acetylase OafA/YrhL
VFFALPRDSAVHYTLTTTILTIVSISVAYTRPGIAERVLRGNDISYGIYIFHGLALNVIVQEGRGGGFWYVPVVWAVTAVIAFASWRLVEQPILRRKRTSLKATTVPTTAVA